MSSSDIKVNMTRRRTSNVNSAAVATFYSPPSWALNVTGLRPFRQLFRRPFRSPPRCQFVVPPEKSCMVCNGSEYVTIAMTTFQTKHHVKHTHQMLQREWLKMYSGKHIRVAKIRPPLKPSSKNYGRVTAALNTCPAQLAGNANSGPPKSAAWRSGD